MGCSWGTKKSDIDVMIESYIAGELSVAEIADFEAHFLECDDCFQKLEIRQQLVNVVEQKGDTLFADYIRLQNRQKKTTSTSRRLLKSLIFKKMNHRWISGIAAAVLLLIVWVGYQNISQKAERSGNFAPSAYLEEMIKTQYQLRGENDLRIESPENGRTFTKDQPIVFRWKFSENSPLTLKILDHRGSRLYQFRVSDSTFQFPEKLQSGLYYWKLESEKDMRIGKFAIK